MSIRIPFQSILLCSVVQMDCATNIKSQNSLVFRMDIRFITWSNLSLWMFMKSFCDGTMQQSMPIRKFYLYL